MTSIPKSSDQTRRLIQRNALLLISDLEFGGAQRQVVELANYMDPERYQMHVCSLADYIPLSERLVDAKNRLHIVRKGHKFNFLVVLKLARLLRKLRVDVLHTFLFDAEFFGRLAGRLAGVPAIIGSERNTGYVSRCRNRWALGLTRWCPHLIIANSGAGAEFNSRTFHQPPEKYRVVHNGVDTDRFFPRESGEVRRELNLEPRHRIVGMFGSFKPQKNHPMLLRAARSILDRVPDARFLFVGDELFMGMSGSVTCKAEIMALVDQLGLRDFCIFVGNREDVENWYPACDLTVLPSLFEGTPNVVLESMASGVPVVATDVSDNRHVIPDGQVGFIVPSGNERLLAERVCQILEDAPMRTRMSHAARDWVRRGFSGPQLAKKVATVYDEVLAGRSSSQSTRNPKRDFPVVAVAPVTQSRNSLTPLPLAQLLACHDSLPASDPSWQPQSELHN
ncbi:MAG: glycosyltransferase [Alphaproteobacteria bacterium]|nr:MAG: glycosyltransferase [Alphaproteobacteria bacterium]